MTLVSRSWLLALACCLWHGPVRAQEDSRAVVIVGAGPGIGARSVRVPSQSGLRSLTTGPYAAVDLRLQLGVEQGRWSLSALADYHSSLGLQVDSSPLPADTGHATLRAHALRAGLIAAYRWSAGATPLRAALFLGWMVRALRSVADLDVPRYSLHGPLLRPELQISLARELLQIRVGPELSWIAVASRDLRDVSGAGPFGWSVGAALAVDFRLVSQLHAVLSYELCYATQRTAWSRAFVDSEHALSARAELRY